VGLRRVGWCGLFLSPSYIRYFNHLFVFSGLTISEMWCQNGSKWEHLERAKRSIQTTIASLEDDMNFGWRGVAWVAKVAGAWVLKSREHGTRYLDFKMQLIFQDSSPLYKAQ
jgi:hypothetical protein